MQFKTKPAGEFTVISTLAEKEPFWRRKIIWAKMTSQRFIPVSVTENDNWSFKGAGILSVPRSFTIEKAKEFERLSRVPEYFPEIRFDSAASTLHLKVNFLKMERQLNLAIFEEKNPNDDRIYFRSLGPWLVGLEGVVIFKDHERQQSEVGILASYPDEVPMIPDWLFQVSSEAVMHHVAEQLRKDVESDYKK